MSDIDNDHGQRQNDDHPNHGKHNGHEDGNDDAFLHRFGLLDGNAIDPAHPGYMYDGNGNPATGFNIADNASEHVEIGLKVKARGLPDQTPAFDSNHDPIYTETSGSVAPNRASWNFDYSADTALGGGKHDLDDYTFKITVTETDTATHAIIHSETFGLARDGSHRWVSETLNTRTFGGDDFADHAATAKVMTSEAENSVNIGFHAFDGFGTYADRTSAGRSYDITMIGLEGHDTVPIVAVHDHVNVV